MGGTFVGTFVAFLLARLLARLLRTFVALHLSLDLKNDPLVEKPVVCGGEAFYKRLSNIWRKNLESCVLTEEPQRQQKRPAMRFLRVPAGGIKRRTGQQFKARGQFRMVVLLFRAGLRRNTSDTAGGKHWQFLSYTSAEDIEK